MHGYVPIEYPKWVGGVVVQNAAEERALERAASTVTIQATPSLPVKITEQMQIAALRAAIIGLLAAKPAGRAEPVVAVPTQKLARTTSPAAERMRLARKRRRDGLRVIPFEIRDDEIGGLVTSGLLEPVARNDLNAIAQALGKLLDAMPPERWPVTTAR